jgi:hypothetical protein
MSYTPAPTFSDQATITFGTLATSPTVTYLNLADFNSRINALYVADLKAGLRVALPAAVPATRKADIVAQLRDALYPMAAVTPIARPGAPLPTPSSTTLTTTTLTTKSEELYCISQGR